ncbi:MAG: sigma-70 family RNA polymerase sigma factor [Clostridia bacterium]|nr:sigma-70 family RNA polymerase sigma factor [Clostridia bacterium]
MKHIKEDILIKEAQSSNATAMEQLITNYKPLVSSIARQYFLLGGETDDLIQEGMMGLVSAIQTYDEQNTASFKTFAHLCIKRKVQTAVKMANRQKYQMLNYFITINNQGIIVTDTSAESNEDENDKDTGIYIESKALDPENAMISKESVKYIKQQIENKLTLLEKNVLQLYIEGNSYNAIAKELELNKKEVDNILFKVKRKLAFLREDE